MIQGNGDFAQTFTVYPLPCRLTMKSIFFTAALAALQASASVIVPRDSKFTGTLCCARSIGSIC